jgi:hypothetical protein
VEFVGDSNRTKIHPIQDPYSKINKFAFDYKWKELSGIAPEDDKFVVGARVEYKGEIGTIRSINPRGKIEVITIALDNGTEISPVKNLDTMCIVDG